MNEYSGILVTLWYCPNEKIKKLDGIPFKSNSSTFDFELIPTKFSFSPRSRIIKLHSRFVLFCCPKNIPRIRNYQFDSFFKLLKNGDTSIAFPSEALTVIKQHTNLLPDPLNTFIARSFRGKKTPEPNFSHEHLEILKRWSELVFAKTPKDET